MGQYGLQYYLNNHVRGVFSARNWTEATEMSRAFCAIADDKRWPR